MCTSLREGGRRCAARSPAGRAAAALRRRIEQAEAAGDGQGAAEVRETLNRLETAREHYGDFVTPMSMDLPGSVHDVFTGLRRQGMRPLVVGGSVRDAFDGAVPKDIDIEVYGASIDKVSASLAQSYRVDEVGKAFGVLKITLRDGTDLDVSVPRRDNHTGAGHRGFTIETEASLTAEDAAGRRDFTINAMGYDPEYGVCVDPYGGQGDLKAKTLRQTSGAFAEDPLRVLRGFQFSSRYGMRFDPETAATCRALEARAGELPVERVRGEWSKFYTKGVDPAAGLRALRDSNWDRTVPGLAEANTSDLHREVTAAARVAKSDGLGAAERCQFVAATIARRMDPRTARKFITQTVEGNDAQYSAWGLSRASAPAGTDDTTVRTWARSLGAVGTTVREWSRVERATGAPARARSLLAKAERLGCADRPQLDLLQGRDVIPRFPGRQPGPWTGDLLKQARSAQDRGEFHDTASALRWLTGKAEQAA